MSGRRGDHRATLADMDADTLTIIGTVLGVGLALAGLSIRTAARQDRRMDRFEAATAAHRDWFEGVMAAHRAEMHRLAERQSHVEERSTNEGSPPTDSSGPLPSEQPSRQRTPSQSSTRRRAADGILAPVIAGCGRTKGNDRQPVE